MTSSRLGQAFIVCAPSGTGKSTLIARLREEFPQIAFSLSCTTRTPRPGEVDGRDYRFVDREEFLSLRDAGHFAEWAEVHGNFYGTPLDATRKLLAQGREVVFDIDVQGAAQLRQSLPDSCFVFLLPPSKAELERRLRGRGSDNTATIAKRMANARVELQAAPEFDYLIVNDDLDTAYAALRTVFAAQREARARHPELVKELLEQWA